MFGINGWESFRVRWHCLNETRGGRDRKICSFPDIMCGADIFISSLESVEASENSALTCCMEYFCLNKLELNS